MTLVCPPVCVQDQLLGLHVQCHPHHLLWFPSECSNLKSIRNKTLLALVYMCLEHHAVVRQVVRSVWEQLVGKWKVLKS